MVGKKRICAARISNADRSQAQDTDVVGRRMALCRKLAGEEGPQERIERGHPARLGHERSW